jgi:hypothetical protein
MNLLRTLIAFCALLALVTVPQAQEDGAKVELPWQVEDLRKTFEVGMSAKWRQQVETGKEKSVRFLESRCTEAGQKSFTVEKVWTDDAGRESARRSETTNWSAHPANYTFTPKDTEAGDETIKVAAGEFETRRVRQTLKDGGETYVSTFWFIKKLPGIFARFETKGGGTVILMELQHFTSASDAFAPLPWSVEDVKKSWAPGVVFQYDIAAQKRPNLTFKSVISAVNAEGFTVVETSRSERGQEETSQPRTRKWGEYLKGLQFDKPRTEVSEETVETPAGKFPCRLYTLVRKGDSFSGTQKVWLAQKEPGLIVKLNIEGVQNNQPVSETWLLNEYKRG